ncbi:MAG: class I SAM-dependent methyltransferase [Flavobacteriaceae bacterium]|nr:class I SAM-dependent methyltransferase [Bacteroidia bacterium]NNK82974.1 class I SAM-dependent methyltransferase [Flavobacteriaceae bacterium]
MTKENSQWYKSWFDTPFYHILYKDRDYSEAKAFMKKITTYLNVPEDGELLDLACGRGRHSIHLNQLGYHVTGLDLSEESIKYAKQFENECLHFYVYDMSKPYLKSFDIVLNLFTSFGYFENEADNQNTINAIKENLKPNGIGVIDFLNSDYIIEHLIPEETKTVEHITFYLKRYVENGYIIKEISFNHEDQDYNFFERVKAFTLEDFKSMFQNSNLQLIDIFGDYNLGKFYKNKSERLIMIFM